MIAQTEMERAEKNIHKKQEKLPCIYSPDVTEQCLVRQAIQKLQDPMTKYTIPKDSTIQAYAGLISAMGEALHSSVGVLASFCEHCPYLHSFDEKLACERWEKMRKLRHPHRRKRKP